MSVVMNTLIVWIVNRDRLRKHETARHAEQELLSNLSVQRREFCRSSGNVKPSHRELQSVLDTGTVPSNQKSPRHSASTSGMAPPLEPLELAEGQRWHQCQVTRKTLAGKTPCTPSPRGCRASQQCMVRVRAYGTKLI